MAAKLRPRSFDKRERAQNVSDGEAFQSFIAECLERPEKGEVRTFPAAGRDGAIDLVVVEPADGRRVFVECKYHADSRGDGPVADWRAVARHLKIHLPALAAVDASAVANSPYSPWLDRGNPVTDYWFCTSSTLYHEGQTERFRGEILKFFAELSNEHPGLAHLAAIEVSVRGWAHFEQILQQRSSLEYRWFGGLPKGLSLLDRESGPAGSFRRFLDGDVLPYISVQEFDAAHPIGGVQGFFSLESLLDQLLSDPRGALLISGAGGLGKTRMALELGRAAVKRNILTVTASAFVDEDGITELAKEHADPAQIIVIIDYAEVFDALDRLVVTVDALAAAGHRIHLIATCRNSAASRVKRAMSDLSLQALTVEEVRSIDGTNYTAWVVGEILRRTGLSNHASLSGLCKGFPVLAAFAVYLAREKPEKFAQQFSDLSSVETFQRWVDRRLAFSFAREAERAWDWARNLAVLSASLEMSAAEVRECRDENSGIASLIDKLESDQWLETGEAGLRAAHDVFADAILSHYLLEEGQPAQSRLGDVLADCQRLGALSRCLSAIDRLASQRSAGRLRLLPALKELRKRDGRSLASAATAILRSRFLVHEEVLELISLDSGLSEAIQCDRELDGPLSHLAKIVADIDDPEIRKKTVSILEPILYSAVSAKQPTNLILRRAFELLPDAYASRVRKGIEAAPTAHETHYLLAAWLRIHPVEEWLRQAVFVWLARWSSDAEKASFVLACWLDAGGGAQPIASEVRTWLNTHRELPSAQFVYKGWLDAGGGTEPIASDVRAWLNSHRELASAQFVYKGWLDAGGGTESIASDVQAWLGLHRTSDLAKFLYQSWLDAGGRIEPIASDMRAWLDVNRELESAQFIYVGWLDAGGGAKPIAPEVRAWLDIHSELGSAQFLYKSWLDAGGGVELIAADVRAWLGIHRTSDVARFVYQSWLNAGGDVKSISADVRGWLDIHQASEGAGFVYRSWLNARGGVNSIAGEVRTWLGIYQTSEGAGFVYRSWLDAGGGTEPIATDVRAWLDIHRASEGADFVYKAWLEAGGSFDAFRNDAFEWFALHRSRKDCVYLTKYIVKQGELPLSVIVNVAKWCQLYSSLPDAICRISPILNYASTDCVKIILSELVLDIMERLDEADIEDIGIFFASISTLSRLLRWAGREPQGSWLQIRRRVDALHSFFLLQFRVYAKHITNVPPITRRRNLIDHIATMISEGTISHELDKQAILEFRNWVANWPEGEFVAAESSIRFFLAAAKLVVERGGVAEGR